MSAEAAGAAAGVAGAYGIFVGAQSLAGALVPWAMSAFGTVVPGVGTMHTVGGVAATLQTASVATIGAASGVGIVAVGAYAGYWVVQHIF